MLVTGTRRCDHISLVLRQLHWLPVRQRVVFKIATLVHRSLSGNAPGYLADDCQLRRRRPCQTFLVGRAAVLETGPLPPQDQKSGTACHPISGYVGCHTASSDGYWRHFYSDSEATARCELFLTALNRNILTLLTYLLAELLVGITLRLKARQC